MQNRETEKKQSSPAHRRIRCAGAALVLALTAFSMLAACGKASPEKLAEAEARLNELADARTQAEAVYETLYDDALFVRLTEAGKEADALAETDLAALTDGEIDEQILPAAEALAETYVGLRELLDQTAETEEAERREREGKKQLTFHVLNQSGEALPALSWEQGTAGARTKLLTIRGPLADGETLAGVTVLVPTDAEETLWLTVGTIANAEEAAEAGNAANTDAAETAADADEAEIQRYEIGRIDALDAGALYYLTLLPEGQAKLTDDPAALSEKESAGDVENETEASESAADAADDKADAEGVTAD